jgi:N-succinyldiaminopimelate aminotransferase
MTAFCDPSAADYKEWNHLVRFTFCKRDDTLDEAIRRLARLRDGSTIPADPKREQP